MTIREQSTIETCLPVCLMYMLEQEGIKMNTSEELTILTEGLKFTKLDYSTGQLVYLSKKYKTRFEQYVEHPKFYRILSKLKYPNYMKIINKKIHIKLIRELVKKSKIILYLDSYHLDKVLHAPHFVVLKSLNDKHAVILDPWYGNQRKIPIKNIIRSIQSLRNNLKLSPKLIRLV